MGSQQLRISPPEVDFKNTALDGPAAGHLVPFPQRILHLELKPTGISHLSVISPQVSGDDQNKAEEKEKDEKSNHLVPTVTKVTLASLQLSGVRFDHRSTEAML